MTRCSCLFLSFLGLAVFVASLVPVSVASQCTHPAVRKEWRKLTAQERADWINAVKCLNLLPHDPALKPTVPIEQSNIQPINSSSSFYDDFVYMHMDLNILIHFTGRFLPWHRYYVWVYSKALAEKCGYTGPTPYWDWSIDSADVKGSPIFASDPVSGLGGWGGASDDFHVNDGGVSALTSTFRLSYPSYHPLRRNFTLQPWLIFNLPEFVTDPYKDGNATFTPEEVNKMVTGFVGDFVGFQKYFEAVQGAHAAIHFTLGGDLSGMCPDNAPPDCVPGSPTFSANEPMFWLHHAMVDKVWYDWQNHHPANAYAYHGGTVQAFENFTIYTEYPNGMPPWLNFNSTLYGDGIFPDATIGDVISTKHGLLCYVYE